jgi:hypothetical protein
MDDIGSLAKVSHKRALVEGKEIQKMLQWIIMGRESWFGKLVWQVYLLYIRLCNEETCWEEFLCTWESIEDGRI